MNVKNIHLLVISKYQKIRFYLISHTNWTFPQVVHIQTFDRDEETHLNPLALLGLVVCNSLEKMSSNSYALFKPYPKQDFVPMTRRDQWTSAWLLTTTWATLAIWWCEERRVGSVSGRYQTVDTPTLSLMKSLSHNFLHWQGWARLTATVKRVELPMRSVVTVGLVSPSRHTFLFICHRNLSVSSLNL